METVFIFIFALGAVSGVGLSLMAIGVVVICHTRRSFARQLDRVNDLLKAAKGGE